MKQVPRNRRSLGSLRTSPRLRTSKSATESFHAGEGGEPIAPSHENNKLKSQQLTRRRSRSDSPQLGGGPEAEEAPLKRQNSMGGACRWCTTLITAAAVASCRRLLTALYLLDLPRLQMMLG